MTIEHRLRIGSRDVLLVEGPAGWGECSPLPGYPCDPAAARRSAEEAALVGWPARVRDSVPVNALVGAESLDPSSWAGFTALKLKVGRRAPDADVERVARVRDLAGPQVRLRVDANGAWDVETAVAMLERLARYDIELAEQPVARMGDLATVRRRVSVRIAADECVRTVEDAVRLRALDAADALVLKVQPVGGVRAGLTLAEEAGVPAVVTSMLETSVGLAAGLALACALPELPFACGLATSSELPGDVVARPLVPHAGVLSVPAEFPPRPASELLDRYAVAA